MFGRIRFLSAGESHGPKLTVIAEGVPAGFAISSAAINEDLARRQQGFGRGGRMKIETDAVVITSGIAAGLTTGAPIAMEVANTDYKNWAQKDIEPMNIPRPGHADLTGAVKYGHHDLRLSLERASARETTMRVCVGALCKQILDDFGIFVGGYVTSIGQLLAPVDMLTSDDEYIGRVKEARKNEFCFVDSAREADVKEHISACMKAKDTLGGVFEIVATGLPVGLGSYVHWDRRLEAQIGQALLSIPAMKGVEWGHAFQNAQLRGTQVHDEMFLHSDVVTRKTNRAAGFEGGVTTGLPLVARVAMKPISTTLHPLHSVNLATGKESDTEYERSDFCAVPRAVPIGEAMMAFVVTNALCEKLGGDSLSEMQHAFKNLRRASVKDLALNNEKWRFDYEQV